MKTTAKIITAFAVAFLLAITGCKKDNTAGEAYLTMRMTEARVGSDTPPPSTTFTAVNVDIQSVAVRYENLEMGDSGWMSLTTKAGVYDLLKLQNDMMATIAPETKLPLGSITQVRLILGPHNSVFIGNDAEQPLKVPSSVIKINTNTAVSLAGHLMITLAFDADKSIVTEGNGSLTLKPVIAVASVSNTDTK